MCIGKIISLMVFPLIAFIAYQAKEVFAVVHFLGYVGGGLFVIMLMAAKEQAEGEDAKNV